MTEQELERRRKLAAASEEGNSPFRVDHIPCSHTIEEALEVFSEKKEEELKGMGVSLMGRIVSWRQSFLTIRDQWNDLQIYVSSKSESRELNDCFGRYLDIGDWVHVSGEFFRTKLGKLTLRVGEMKIISKCINPFPSQYYGIQDEELKVRNRVARALVDEDFYRTMVTRSRIISAIRGFLDKRGYLELETPILERTYGGANAVPFVTRYESLKEDFFLRIATEIPLKKAVISGFSRVYEIGRVFRNEGIDSSHNPEFTSLEMYTVNNNLDQTMDLVEQIFGELCGVLKIREVVWNGHDIDLSKPFKRISMAQLVKERVGVDFYKDDVSLEDALGMAEANGIEIMDYERTVGHIFQKLFDELVADSLIQPTFVHGFHRNVSPLSKTDPNNGDFVLRYELYIGGMEFSNGFAELNDPDDQRSRFEEQAKEREGGNREAFGIDHDYIFSLQYGLPPTGGIGIGIDRLIMLFTQKSSIKEVIFFPQVKSK